LYTKLSVHRKQEDLRTQSNMLGLQHQLALIQTQRADSKTQRLKRHLTDLFNQSRSIYKKKRKMSLSRHLDLMYEVLWT